MDLDIAIHKGRSDRPVIILIHGLGMGKEIWLNPLDTRVFAKNIPLRVFAATPPKPPFKQDIKRISIGEIPKKINSLWPALRDEGFNIICWSQRRPVGPISAAVNDLEEVMKKAKRLFPKRPVALICHSRGGLIARKFMEKGRPEIKALITVATPHAGSALSRLGSHLSPLSLVLDSILPRNTRLTTSRIVNRVTELLKGNALKELLPDSDFFKNLEDTPVKGVKYISFGGTEPRVLTIYTLKKKYRKVYPRPLLSIPDSLLKVIPSALIPDELLSGKGDILVTAKSSLMPWATEHYNLPVNHVSILWHRKVINNTLTVLKKI